MATKRLSEEEQQLREVKYQKQKIVDDGKGLAEDLAKLAVLTAQEEVLKETVQKLRARRVASRLGNRNLLDQRVLQRDQRYKDLWTFESADGERGGRPRLFLVDPGEETLTHLRKWLQACEYHWPNRKDTRAPGLTIAGFVKTGKSLALNRVLPALIREHSFFGVDTPREAVILKLSCESWDPTSPAEFLMDFFLQLKSEAKAQGLHVDVQDPPVGNRGKIKVALKELFMGLPVDQANFLFLDDIEAWYLLRNAPRVAEGEEQQQKKQKVELNLEAVEVVRGVLKWLLTELPGHVLPAITGSSMVGLFVSYQLARTTGDTLLGLGMTVFLPAEVTQEHKEAAWLFLQDDYAAQSMPLPAQLLRDCPRQPATFTYMARCYAAELPSPDELEDFVAAKEEQKILAEMSRDFQFVFDALEQHQSKLLAALAIPTVGVERQSLTPGLRKLFKPYMVESLTRKGYFYLRAGYFRQAVQRILTEHGALAKVPDLSIPLMVLHQKELLTVLGEVGNKAYHNWADHHEYELLMNELEAALPHVQLQQQTYAQKVLQDVRVQQSVNGYLTFCSKGSSPASEKWSWFLYLVRCVLSHNVQVKDFSDFVLDFPLQSFLTGGRFDEVADMYR